METQTTKNMENAPGTQVASTETTETSKQPTLPVVDHPQTTETLEQLPPLVSNMPAAETSLSEPSNTQETESLEPTTLSEVTKTHETAPCNEPTPPPVAKSPKTETVTMEKPVIPLEVTDNSHENLNSCPENHQGVEMRLETAEEEEEARNVLKVIAATGKFWYDWEDLRSILSIHLKQVISEYPQAKMTLEGQKVTLGETYAELAKRLDDALLSFVDGPPFTLQRLSEIILDARSLYPNLSKLALALEKNLSVTSTMTISTDPYPSSSVTTPNGLKKVTEEPIPRTNPQTQSDTVMENGTPPVSADNDEIMTEVEVDVNDVITMDVETNESLTTTDIGSNSRGLEQPTDLSKL